jgi:hypothetical protein
MNKQDYTIFINDEVYTDDFGNPYRFETSKEAKEFIEEQELDNAEVVRQYGKFEDSE